MVDNIATDIDFTAIEAAHQTRLQLYKDEGAEPQSEPPVELTQPLIPLQTAGRKSYGGDRVPSREQFKQNQDWLSPVDEWDQMGYEDEVTKHSNETDPCGKNYKGFNSFQRKPSKFAASAWGDSSSGDEIADLWGDVNCSDDGVEFTKYESSDTGYTQLFEKTEEIEVSTDKIAADIQEVSRDVGELVPLVSDTNEDVRTLTSDITKMNRKITAIEHSLKKIQSGVTGLNEYMKIIVDHLTNDMT
jgi:hypothetical protein